jgi:hypothetical protein
MSDDVLKRHPLYRVDPDGGVHLVPTAETVLDVLRLACDRFDLSTPEEAVSAADVLLRWIAGQPAPERNSSIAAERDALTEALSNEQDLDRWSQLYAARQALGWALNPDGYRPPLETIQEGGCWGHLHLRAASSRT